MHMMTPLTCRLSIVLLLTTASLALGSSVLLNATPAQPRSSTTDSGASAKATDGFQRTAQAFQSRVNKARRLIEILHGINAEAKASVPDNPSKQQAYFLTKLNGIFPGSTYDGVRGKIVFQKNFEALFSNTLNVDSITELGEVSATYFPLQGRILISFGSNSVTAVIDRANPSRSRFTNVSIPAIRVSAETILSIPGYRRITTDSVETSILNDAYQLLSQTNDYLMDNFAADVMRSSTSQNRALAIAGRGYLERHPLEYQRGVDPANSAKVTDRILSLSVGAVTKLTGLTVLLLVAVIGFFWVARRTISFIRILFLDSKARRFIKQYKLLTPLVQQSLRRLGRTLWGRNYPWKRNYYLTRRTDRWTLSDQKIDRYNLNSLPNNLIEVCLRESNFKIHISRIRGAATDIVVRTDDHSRQNLKEQLQRLSAAFSQEETTSGDSRAAPLAR